MHEADSEMIETQENIEVENTDLAASNSVENDSEVKSELLDDNDSETSEVEDSNSKEDLSLATEDSNDNADSETVLEESETIQQDADSLLPLIQALLISSNEPVEIANLAKACDSSEELLIEALNKLEKQLDQDQYGFCLAKIAKGYQLRTKPQYAKYIRLLKDEAPRKLSSAALETLAVVAYRQPVVKHDIDGIRGVDVMPTLKTLIDRGLVQAVGHKDTVGHPVLYGTTDEFLKIFGLNTVEDLPKLKELNKLDSEPGEKADSFVNPMKSLADCEVSI